MVEAGAGLKVWQLAVMPGRTVAVADCTHRQVERAARPVAVALLPLTSAADELVIQGAGQEAEAGCRGLEPAAVQRRRCR